MGDKSPKAKQRDKNQKQAAKNQSKSDVAKKQEGFSMNVGKDKRK